MRAGQDPTSFGRFSFREIQIILTQSALRDARLCWMSAQYARFAFHNPNEMPEDPAEARTPGENRPADVAFVRAWFKARSTHGN